MLDMKLLHKIHIKDLINNMINENLPQERTVKQLKWIKSIMDKEIGGDIDDKTEDEKGANLYWHRNPIRTGIESYQDWVRKNRKRFRS